MNFEFFQSWAEHKKEVSRTLKGRQELPRQLLLEACSLEAPEAQSVLRVIAAASGLLQDLGSLSGRA